MNAFLFPGQGSQEVGMGAELFSTDSDFRQWVGLASECAGADLQKICLRGPERELVKTEHLQPLLVAVSLGYWSKLVRCGVQADIVLGHSLGEIAALAAAGVIDPRAAVMMAARRGQLMGRAASKLSGGMLAVLSPNRQSVLETLSPLLQSGRLFLANDNAPEQLLLSGDLTSLSVASQLLTAAKLGPCKNLPVAGPWHSPLMVEAQLEFAAWLSPIPFQEPRIPILMNTSASLESDPEAIRRLLVRNLTEPVQWRSSMQRLAQMLPRTLFEVGPGRVLSGLARANGIGEEARILNINNQRGLVMATLWLSGQQSNPQAYSAPPTAALQ